MYEVKFYKGDYQERQEAANADSCVAYVEHHFNAAGPAADYSLVIVGSNASTTSQNWGRWYAQAIADEFGIPRFGGNGGIIVGGFDGRGDANVKYTTMPAVLLEPLFASNPEHAEWIRGEDGRRRLAGVLVRSIQRFFPDGGKIAFSVGHKYKTSRPNDRGAAVAGGGTEADFAEMVLDLAAQQFALQPLEPTIEDPRRSIEVIVDGAFVLQQPIDEDAVVTWNATLGRLTIA